MSHDLAGALTIVPRNLSIIAGSSITFAGSNVRMYGVIEAQSTIDRLQSPGRELVLDGESYRMPSSRPRLVAA